MTRHLTAIAFLATLTFAACGVDGEPEQPTRAIPATGMAISGTASAGIVVNEP